MEKITAYWEKLADLIMTHGVKILVALIVLFIGLKLISWLAKFLKRSFAKRNLDETLRPFIVNIVAWTLRVLLFISVASMVGIKTTSFVAIVGAAGLAIGLALQGSLGNFAGGVLILMFKPFKVGDLIEAQGYLGVVEEIQMFVTKITTPENRVVILPNGDLSNGSIKNLSEKDHVRVDIVIGISYDSDIKKARDVILGVMSQDSRIKKEPSPFVGVLELADSSVNLAIRPWASPGDYWGVFFDITEKCKLALDENNITIPFPQTDVHLRQVK